MMYSAATGSLYSDVHRGVSSLAFGLWGKRWRPPNGTSEGGPTGGSLRPLVWFYFARWIILPGECRPLQQPTFLTHLDSFITRRKKKWGNPGTPLFRDLTPLVDFWDPQPNNCGATVGGGYGHWRSTAKKKLRPVRLQGIYSYIFIFLRTALFLCSCWYSLIGNPDFCTQKCQGGQHK